MINLTVNLGESSLQNIVNNAETFLKSNIKAKENPYFSRFMNFKNAFPSSYN